MMFNRQMSLWMGDLDPYMEEDFIKQAFSAMGESPTGVKIITHKITGGSAGYCFVELADEASVERCVQRLNGKLVPGSNPDFQLQQVFKNYPSCKGAKVVTDQYGYSRGYGFVKFGEESEQKKAIEECQGTMLSGKPLRLSVAVAKSQKISSYQGGQGQNYSSYNQSQSSYYGSNNSVAQGGYYSQWGGYDQYSGYNSSYNNTYNTGYNTGYNSGYNYNYGYGYPPPGHMPPPPIGMPPTSTDMSGAVEQNHEETGAVEEETADESIPECDVEQWNKDYMERSEEFYDALMNSHWEPLDTVDAPIPSMS